MGGAPQTLTARINNAAAANPVVSWNSSNTRVDVVQDRSDPTRATIIGVAATTEPVIITATLVQGVLRASGSASVTVLPAPPTPTVTVMPPSATLQVNATTTIVATVANATPAGATVAWSAGDARVQVTPTGNSAVVKGLAPTGNTPFVLTATYTQGGTAVSASSTISVIASSTAQVTRIELTPANPCVAPNTNVPPLQFVTRYFDAAGNEVAAEAGSQTEYAVDVSSVAGINAQTGLANVRAAGTTPVEAYYRVTGRTTLIARTTLTVSTTCPSGTVARIVLEPREAEITAPATLQYRALLFDAQGNRITTPTDGGVVTYSSSNTAAANFLSSTGAPGLITGTAAGGTTTVTARYTRGTTVVSTDATPLVVYAAGTAGHFGALQIVVPNDAREVAVGQQLVVTVTVRDANNNVVTANQPSLTLEADKPAIEIVRDATGANRFIVRGRTATGTATDPLAGVVKLTAEIDGASASIYMIVRP